MKTMTSLLGCAFVLAVHGCSAAPNGDGAEPIDQTQQATIAVYDNLASPNNYTFVPQQASGFTNCPSGRVLHGIDLANNALCAVGFGTSATACGTVTPTGTAPNRQALCPVMKFAIGYRASDQALNCCGGDAPGGDQGVNNVHGPSFFGHSWLTWHNPAPLPSGHDEEFDACTSYNDAITGWNLTTAQLRCGH